MDSNTGQTVAEAVKTPITDTVFPNPNHAGLRMFSQRGNLIRGDYSGDNYPPNGYILDLVVIYDKNLVDKFGESDAKRRYYLFILLSTAEQNWQDYFFNSEFTQYWNMPKLYIKWTQWSRLNSMYLHVNIMMDIIQKLMD